MDVVKTTGAKTTRARAVSTGVSRAESTRGVEVTTRVTGERVRDSTAGPTRGAANSAPSRAPPPSVVPTRGQPNTVPTRRATEDDTADVPTRGSVPTLPVRTPRNDVSTAAKVTRVTAYWEVVSGAKFCEIVDGGRCVTDGQGKYGTNEVCRVKALVPVSYTHLTLPTKA